MCLAIMGGLCNFIPIIKPTVKPIKTPHARLDRSRFSPGIINFHCIPFYPVGGFENTHFFVW